MRFLRRYGLISALAFLYLYSFPHFAEIRSANELPRAYLTQAMVEEGTFAIDSGVRKWGRTADVSPSKGKLYSNKAPGSSILAIPGYLVVKLLAGDKGPSLASIVWVSRVTTGVVPTLVFLILLWRFLARYVPEEGPRQIALVAYAVGSMAMTYSVLFIAHQLSAVCIASAFFLCVWVIEDGRDQKWMLLAGFLAGAAPLVDYQAAFAGVPIAAYALYYLAYKQRRFVAIAFAIAGAIGPIALLLIYHWKAFGSPLATGYDASETFAHYHQQGFLGMDQFRWEALWGSTISADNGLFFFSPFWLLMIPGAVLMWRKPEWRWHLGVCVATVIIYLLFISSINFWRGGWQLGPRYITVMLPFALIPTAICIAAMDRKWYLRGLVLALVIVGVVAYALSCAEYPHFPEKFKNPLFEVTFRLIADGAAPFNAGWLVGLRGFASLIPYLLVLVATLAWIALPEKARWRSAAMGLGLAALILGIYSTLPGGGPVADKAYVRWVRGVMPK